jgi:hypothetical protein
MPAGLSDLPFLQPGKMLVNCTARTEQALPCWLTAALDGAKLESGLFQYHTCTETVLHVHTVLQEGPLMAMMIMTRV